MNIREFFTTATVRKIFARSNRPARTNTPPNEESTDRSPYATEDLVVFDVDVDDHPYAVLAFLSELLHEQQRCTDPQQLLSELWDRELKMDTGIPLGIAIPHCRSTAITEPTVAMLRLTQGVDFSGPDGPSDLIFCIACPATSGREHLKILSRLSRHLVDQAFVASLRSASSPDAVAARINQAVTHG